MKQTRFQRIAGRVAVDPYNRPVGQGSSDGDKLRAWLSEVLGPACKDGVMVLQDGREASLEWDGECVSVYTYEPPNDEPKFHARVRLVSEDPSQD